MPPKFVPRERKHRRLAKLKETSKKAPPTQSNEEVIVPVSKSEQEERRQQIRDELRAHQPDAKISGKKRKRLDHYVDTKLRKEENLELIKKLASHQIDTSLLQSSKKLGRVNDTRREVIERALKERQAGIDVRGDQDEVLYERRGAMEAPAHVPIAVSAGISNSTTAESFGSGLKRPLDVGEDGKPVLPSRKRRKREKKARSVQEPTPMSDEGSEGSENTDEEAMDSESDQDEWNGFSDDEIGEHSTEESRENAASDSEDDSATSNYAEESTEDEDDDENSEIDDVDKPARASAFKMWAAARRNEAIGFEPSIAPTSDPAVIAAFKPRVSSPDPAQPAATTTATTARPEKAITINRVPDIQAARLELPVVQEEQKIMEAIHNNPITIICGETGSGKTTQVPQMMYEAGYGTAIGKPRATSEKSAASFSRGMIGITQPRRVAAVSVAQRVKTEMGSEFSRQVAHQVRYDSAVTNDTAMKFMTDGILLREISQDFVLSKYSAIVVDEAHERSVNTDILIGMLSRIVPLRAQLAGEQPTRYSPLKLVIMSATLRVSDFIQNDRLFKGVVPPIVEAEGRQHPVTVHFSRTTERNFVSEMVRKLERAHRKLPHGGMLVFLTGQQEIQDVAARLNQVLGGNASYSRPTTNGRDSSFGFGADDYDNAIIRKRGDTLEGEDEAGSDVEINGTDSDAEDVDFDVPPDPAFKPKKTQGLLKPHILPLYAALPTSQQMRVFQDPPEGHRLIVLATNVAETSLTIPDIRYVFDCGRSKEKVYDTSAGPGIQTFEIDWISKASAAQRTGRAGRTGPGHCYRLYSSAVFEEFFAEHAVPEVLRTPLENVVLQLKSMEIENVVNFPFPTPPDRKQLEVAETLLRNLGAIDEGNGKITPLGRQLLAFPVSPRFGKILLLAHANEVVTPAVATVAALAVGALSMPEVQAGAASVRLGPAADDESDDYDGNQQRRVEREGHTAAEILHQKYTRAQAKLSQWDNSSDAVKMLATVAVHADAMLKKNGSQICKDFYLHEKPLQEAQQLRQQLHNIIASELSAGFDHANVSDLRYEPSIPIPSEKRRKMLNQVVAAGFIDQIALRADLLPSTGSIHRAKRANQVPYRTLMPSVKEEDIDHALSQEDQDFQRSVYVHSASVLAKLSATEMPPYIVYSHMSRASPSSVKDGNDVPRTRIHPLCVVSAKQIASLAEGTPLLQYGKPIQKIEELDGGRRRCWVGIEVSATRGGIGWPLGTWRVEQVRGRMGDWVVEKVLQRYDHVGGVWYFDERSAKDAAYPSTKPSVGDSSEYEASLSSRQDRRRDSPVEGSDLDYDEASIAFAPPGPCYDGLRNNVSTLEMEMSTHLFKAGTEEFVSQRELADYLQDAANANNAHTAIKLDTRVEDVQKIDGKWRVETTTLTKMDSGPQYTPRTYQFDAVVAANGNYHAMNIPDIPGLKEWKQTYPDRVMHSKLYRRPQKYRDQNVLVVGASVSSTDIVRELGSIAKATYQSSRGGAYDLPTTLLPDNCARVSRVKSFDLLSPASSSTSSTCIPGSVTLTDGTVLKGIDSVILATGYHVSFPFLRSLHADHLSSSTADHRVLVTDGQQTHNLHKDIFYIPDPTLSFIGVPYHTATWTFFEFQAMALAQVLAGKAALPSEAGMREEYERRLTTKGAGRAFHSLKGSGQEIASVNDLVEWVNGGKEQVREGDYVMKGHSEKWLASYARRQERFKLLFGPSRDNAVDERVLAGMIGCV
nr:hypothetical protein B0A51_02343 [Rachicladosporium sp. CCFEE 5018]